jgi:hypothetical protein
VLELLTQSTDLATARIATAVLFENDEALLIDLACMHVDVLRVLLTKFGSGLENRVSRQILRSACRIGSVDVVQELLNNHQDKFGDWIVGGKMSFVHLEYTHVDVLCMLLSKFGSDLEAWFSRKMMNYACRNGSGDAVRELLDNHKDKFEDWSVDDFNDAAVRGNVPVLRLLSLSRYGGCKKLAENPPLNRICTRRVLEEMYVKSSFMLMFCIKKKTTARIMAKLLDVLRDLISSDLLRYKMK